MVNREDREKIQTLLHKNLVVEAGAGTGKTTLLITRLCVAILVQAVPVEKLVALTFTEKAAAEIKTRLMMQLREIIQSLSDNKKTRFTDLLSTHFEIKEEIIISRAEAALARLDRAQMGTIHSFCADILKTFPLEAGLAPHAEIDSGARAKRLFEARWNSFLDRELGQAAPRAKTWKQVLPHIALPDLKSFAQELCSGKIAAYDYFSNAGLLTAICEEKAKQALAWSTQFLENSNKPRNSEKALAWAVESLRRSAAFLRTRQIPAALQEETPPAFPSIPSKGWPGDTFEEARALVEFAQKITPENQQIFLQALELVLPLVEQVRFDYAQNGILSFDDLIVKTRDLLKSNFYVRRLLKEKFDLLFIDEFQDTDPVQGELLLFLAEEKQSSADCWQKVRLAPGKLFVVGDPKQSIYRFRGADITAYELFVDLILKQNGEKCFLQKNFRSAPDIVTVANEVCRRAMVQQDAFQPAYVPIFAAKESRPKAVEWLFITPPENPPLADDYRHNQAEQIARWIETNVGRMTLANGKKLTYGDIAILSRAATTCGPYTDALRRHGIAFNVEVDKDFFRKQEINDFLNFLRVVSDPQGRTALAGVLRSPLGGFSDEEIYQIAMRGELDLQAKTKDTALAACYELIRNFAQKAGRLSLKELLADVLENTFLPEACAASYDGERTLANLQRLVRVAEEYAANSPTSLGQFLAHLQELLETEPERLGASRIEDAENAVSVMTIHKSKGLGFPVVILADLSKREAAAAAQPVAHLFSWQYNMHGLRAGKICDANLAFLEEEQQKHSRCEEIRILYVALTRAQEKMLLVADGRQGAEKAARAFVAAGLFPTGAEKEISIEEVTLPVSCVAYENPESFLYRHPAPVSEDQESFAVTNWKRAFETRRKTYEQYRQNPLLSPSEQILQGELLSPEQRAGAAVGTICHRALEILLRCPNTKPESAVLQAAVGLETFVTEAEEIVCAFVQSTLWREIKQCSLLAAEMPFSYQSTQGIQTGRIDAVLQPSADSIWILDYKTDKITPQGAQAILEKYRPQLTVYKAAAQQIFPDKKVRVSAILMRAFAAEDL